MNSTTMHREKDVAVVGIACRFPGAEDYDEYWRNLQSGVNSIREIPGSRWSVESYYSKNIAEKNKSISKWCGIIDKIDTFDNRYFNISPREAKHMDPQQRIMLEETVRCIEDAGVSRARLSAGRTSFFTGIMAIDHQQIAAMPGIETDSFSCLGSYAGIVSNRISHFFDFSGVSYTMDAACASSMVAVVEARKSLISGESDYAFAAGISLDFHPWKYISFSKSRMLSPNGRCKTFDNSADGYVPGEGAGVLLLRRLNDARASGDHIYGIIKGAAVNHCGKTLSITAPSVAAQSRVIRDAVEDAGIDPSTIGYIEAHGTGTSLGDPIEIEALSRAFGAYTDKKQFCRIGSVKTNIGHLEAAAGVAGLIKVLLMMKHRRIPGIVNLEQLNPIIDFKNSPFKVARETVAWKSFGRSIPLRASVSSFGMGGVNSHVILEAWETDGEVEKSEPPGEKFFLLSAKSEKSLEALRRRWDDFIGEAHWASYSLRDICGTLMTGREHHPYRHGVIVNNREALREAITKGEMTVYRKGAATPRLVISAFSAEGDTSISSLTQSDALFKGRLDRILAQCATHVAAGQFCEGNRRGAKSEVEAFVVEAAMLGSILEAVPEIPCMEVRTDRIWPVLTTAGMISAPQVAAYLATGTGIDRMTLKRPRLALTFSEALGSLSPYRIDTAYVEQLFDGISVEGTELHRFVQKARIMYENQYTFRNYLAEWERVLWENGLDLQELIGGTGAAVRSGAESLDLQGPKRLLQLTVIAVSLSKLNLKWDLTQRLPSRGAFLELMDLIVDQVLEKNWLVDYLFSEEMTSEELAQMMERRQDRIDKTKAYRVLRKNSERLVEAGDVGEWIARVEEGGRKGLPVAPMSDRKSGKPRGSSEEPEVVFRSEGNAASAYRRVLLELWRCGADVRFEKIMPDGSFGKVQLPTYRFDKYYFWLKEKEKENNRGKLVSEDRERWEREPGEEIAVEVYPLSRAIIQDHVITDEHIVPAAAMIAQARRICNSKNPSAEWDFADVYIIRPGIVRQDGVTLHGQIIGNSSVILKDQSDSVMFRAELVKNRMTPSGKIDLQDMEARMTPLSGSVYAEMEAVGYRYGKTLRTVKREGAFGDFQLFEIGGSSRLCFDGSEIAPELLDGIFQAAVIAALRENRPLFREKILVPYKIGRFCLFGAMDRTCYALFDNADFGGGTGDQKVSVSVYDEEGSPLATIEQMVFKRVNKSFLTSHKNSKPVHTIRCDPQDCGCHDPEAQDRPNPVAEDHRTLEGRGSLSLEKKDFHNTEEVEGGKTMEGFYGADAEQMLFFYRPIWKKQALTADEKKELGDLAVVFYDPWDKLSIDFLGAVSSRYETVIKVSEAGPAVDPDGDFVLASDDESAYEDLLRQVRERERDREVRIDIFYFWKSGFRYEDSGDMPESILKISHIAKPFFNLVKALARLKPGKKVRILLCTKELHVVGQGDGGKGFPYGILTGFKETVELENPEIEIVCVDLEERLSRVSETAQCLLDEASRRDARDHTAFRGEDRYVRQFKRMVDDVHGENGDGMPRLRRGGNYILAGGAGGICDHLLALLARQAEVNLIVLGRSEPTMEKQKRFREISNGKAPIRYLRADVTDYGELARVVDRIRAEFGPVNGVIHAGGIIDDQLIASKTWVSFDRVIAVKTIGTLNLDALTREDPLEFFVVFSSIVSVVGNFGQVDYAAGNSFVDAFIHYRRKSGVAGASIAIDWPLWRGTGMGKGEAAVENFKSRELAPISPVKGVSAFQKIIREKDAGQIVVAGNEIKFASFAREKSPSKELKKDRGKLKAIESYLAKLIAAKIDFAPEEIDRNKSFFSMGVESIVLTEIMETLGKRYDKLPSTLLFEYPRVESLAQYLLENGVEIQGAGLEHAVATVASTDASPAGEEGGGRPADDSFHPGDPPMRDGRGMEAENLKTVAIIGMGCRMPEAGNMDQFFRNLLEKRDCIREVPDDRWNMAEYFREEEREGVFSYGKWGGFLDDVDKFDPLFFGITPREAGQMDPQQRILLENVWETMEHAGYGEPGSYAGRKIGLFVGMMWNDYSHLANQMGFMKGQYKGPGSLFWAVANRVSYEMNFRGPSMAVDTACSSSLTAVHLARQSILNGECDMAVAGGINLSLHPSKYVYLSQAKFLSKDGRCRSFGKGGTGYVPGEGVGCVLLKRLDRAVDEGDRIYGIIRGTSLNHGGKVTGFTVPSPEVQGELIADCLADAGMEGIRVDYVECHGTGTTLGDPIEIKGLKRAFEKSTERKQFCPVGSVKSNIGHLEAASGIAGIIKVLLSFAYDKIPGSIHAAEKNPYIDFADSPFYLLENTLPFKANPKRPRVAGVSSFGAGGSNAHVILEANDRMDSAARPAAASRAKYLIAISARTDERLAAYARKMIGFFSTSGDLSMDDVEYTLLFRRKSFEQRLAVVCSGKEQLIGLLDDYLCGKAKHAVFKGDARVEENRRAVSKMNAEVLLDRGTLEEIAAYWAIGGTVGTRTWAAEGGRIMALPTYPFARERYWLHEDFMEPYSRVRQNILGASIHPMLDRNASKFDYLSFEKLFVGDEFYLVDHIIGGRKVLPGVACLEMVYAAQKAAGGADEGIKMTRVSWEKILAPGDHGRNAAVRIDRDGRFELVSTGRDGATVRHCRGRVALDAEVPWMKHVGPESLGAASGGMKSARTEANGGGTGGKEFPIPRDMEALIRSCSLEVDRQVFYASLKQRGADYGPSFQTVQALRVGDGRAISHLAPPEGTEIPGDGFALHPALMDGALQTVLGLAGGGIGGNSAMYLPLSVESVEIRSAVIGPCAVVAERSGNAGDGDKVESFDIDVVDLQGNLLVQFRGFAFISVGIVEIGRALGEVSHQRLACFGNRWEPSALSHGPEARKRTSGIILWFDNGNEGLEAFVSKSGARVMRVVPGTGFRKIEDDRYTVASCDPLSYGALFETLRSQGHLPQTVVQVWQDHRGESSEEILQTTIYPMFHMVKAAMRAKIPRLKILYAYPAGTPSAAPFHEAMGAFAKTLRLENPGYRLKVVGVENTRNLGDILTHESSDGTFSHMEVLYDGEGVRRVRRYDALPMEKESGRGGRTDLNIEGGVYLITGGTGGLGLIFAEYLARKKARTVVLTGRSDLSEEKGRILGKIEGSGTKVAYLQGDISRRDRTEALISDVTSRFGRINGVIHGAGVTRDAFIFKKAAQDLDAVFGPKVMGTVNLIDALSGAAPDFVVLFSSIAGGAGNAGQCDYAYANGFMDCYTAFIGKREQATRTKYISIGWPLWADGGMGVDPHVQKYLEETLGMVPLSTANGIRGFEACLAMGEPHVILVEGDPEVALKVLNSPGGGKTEAAVRQGATAGSDGRRHEMDETQGRPAAPILTSEVPGKGNEASASVFVDRLEDYLKDVLHRQTEIPTARIRSDEPLELYGIDSVMIMKLTRVLEKDFGELSRTLFFEYQTIGELAVYFTENHPETVGAKFGEAASGAKVPAPADFCVALESGSRGKVSNIAFEVDTGPESVLPAGSSASGGENQGIAIIGLAGRYPQAENIAEFWRNLEKGRDCIVEVPGDRWDYKPFFHPRKDGDGTIYHKWGGFLDHADKFDPLFFNISPREAELMDPQERIFLECAWHTLEDAGYARSALRGLPVGVFVGVMWGEYQIVGEEASGEGRLMGAGSVYASIANRVSYFFDFKGPSMAVDTMCSSSLTSIHLACESIIRGECSLAVAGGVNLSLHPHKYRQLSRGNFVSTDGKCRSFGEGGDGYVPGEGVGAVLLKPVDRAVRDGDHIYGVILASVINHGGKTNGYTVPNPNAQTDLISAALKKSGIDPGRINCVEAHGTGTALGDPIEMTGLLNALGKEANGIGKCAVGSVKSNIGHLEAAAGIASLTKVLMQLKHRKIVPSLHSDVTNSNIRFDKIPFYTPQALSDWELPQTGDQGSASPGRRVAGISAFGAGGANAHLIVEEYVPETTRALPAAEEPFVFVLSARNKQRLWKYAERMAAFLEKKSAEHMETPTEKSVFHESICSFLVETAASMLKVDPDEIVMDVPVSEFGFEKYETTRILRAVTAEFEVELAPPSVGEFPSLNWIAERAVEERGDGKPSHGEPTVPGGGKAESKGQVEHPVARDTAYTLQVGREEMEERLAFTADSSGEAGKVLQAFLAGDGEGERWFTGRVGDEVHSIHKIINGEEGRQFVATAIQSGKLDKIARLWVSGVRIDWELLYNRDLRPSRVSLPQYPFERERYWVVEARRKGADSRAATSRQWLHPLLGANRSTIKGFRFRTEFTGDEHYFRDHEVQGRMILPGAASVEMARKACEIVSESFVSGGKNIIWHRPVEFAGNSLLVDTIIQPRENGLDFQVVTVGKAGEENVNVTGRFLTGDPGKELNRLDLGAVAARCAEIRSPDGCYAAFKEWGIRYGSAFRGIREIRHGDDEVLVKLSIPSVADGENQGSGLHPSLMDGAMQSIFTLLESSGDTVGDLFLPVRLGTLEIQGELPKTLSCYGRYARNRLEGGSGIRKFDLDLVDADGRIIVRVRDFTVGRYRNGTETEINRTVCRNYQTEWDASRSPVDPEPRGTVMVLGDLSAGQRVSLFPPLPGRRFIHVKPAQSFAEYDTDIFGVNPSDKNDFERLFGILAQRKQVPERVIVSWSGVGDGRQADEYRREAAAGLGNGREDVEESIRPEENGTAGEEHRAGESVGETLHRRARLSLDSLYYLVQALVPMKSTHSIRMVYLGFSVDGETDPLMDAMGAFARTLNIEYPDIRFRVVEVDVVSDNERARAAKIGHRVLQELNDSEDGPVEVRYRDDKRYVRNVRHIGNEGKNAGVLISKFRVGGVYLVTGGLGGLGWIVAQYLSGTYNAKLVLTGRSAGSKRIENRLDALRKLGGEAVYARSDVSKLPDVKQVIDLARKRFGKLNGIIHSAGTILDEYILKKDCRELDRVLAPKLVGTLLLDEATRDVPIDFMVYFSSIASVFGNAGQADYAFANGFMDGYARKREALREKKCCHGKTVSINWPLWKDGGMHVDAQTIRAMEESLGITPMETAKGIAELENALKVSVSQLAVMHGYGGRMADAVESMNRGVRTAPVAALGPDGDAAQVEDRDRLKTVVVAYLSELFARTSKIPLEKIKEKEPLERYGIDSVMITAMTGKIEKEFGKLSKTLFFEYRTIDELGDFFVRRHPGKIRGLEHTEDGPVRVPAVGGKDKASGTVDYAVAYQGVDDDKLKGTKSVPSNAFGDEGSIGKKSFSPGSKGGTEPSGAGQEIAIIGIAGRYPKAKNLGEFWENLKAGRDCIEPVPAARWDWHKLVVQNGKSGRKELYGWGGFLDDIDRFDPLFFNISPKDAEMIDPQERLFLECAWRTVEDAGYTRKKLESQNVGTFIGVMWGEYQMFGAEEIMNGNIIAPTASYASIANRTSYFLNLSGPSMAVDTMCSSSLAAIHLACNSIRNDECDMAIAGGVNLSLHAGKYVALGRGGFLASDGRCRTFGNGGDGYVPGEGVGAVMLKPLNRAVADGDRIHAVIKASALNHGGRTNGYTVPNPRAQADVITKALERARVPAVSIGYVEAHGTGTSLGDPIEISGLCRAYGDMDERKHSCPVGSVKSNVGHLESAAGIAGLTKLVLQMQHKTLVPSIHSEELNPNIDFEETPFLVQRKLSVWPKIHKEADPDGETWPRRAGLSAFGAGGANAHLILEEFLNEQRADDPGEDAQHLIVLSAKTDAALAKLVENLRDFIRKGHTDALTGRPVRLSEMAYTLQCGREAFKKRLGIIAEDIPDLLVRLEEAASGRPEHPAIIGGEAYKDALVVRFSAMGDREKEACLAEHCAGRMLKHLGILWVSGANVPWEKLYTNGAPAIITIPGYPFSRRKCWYSSVAGDRSNVPVTPKEKAAMKNETPHRGKQVGTTHSRFAGASYDKTILGYEKVHENIVLVTMKDRQYRNVFRDSLVDGLISVFDDITRNETVRTVVITGHDDIFCMGGTREQLLDIAHDQYKFTDTPFLYRGFMEMDIPVISAIQGHASGGGLLFGLYADIVVMSEESIYTAPFMKYGFTPGMGATYILEEKLGRYLAREMMFTARAYRGGELRDRGAKVVFVQRADVLKRAMTMARALAEKPRGALATLKKEFAKRSLETLERVIEVEAQMHLATFKEPEVQERIKYYYPGRNNGRGQTLNKRAHHSVKSNSGRSSDIKEIAVKKGSKRKLVMLPSGKRKTGGSMPFRINLPSLESFK